MTNPRVGRLDARSISVAVGLGVSLYLALDTLVQRASTRRFAEDFDPSFWEPWKALRSGTNPYPSPIDPLADGPPFLYPPLSAELTLPLSWLPYTAAAILFALGLVVAAALTLWALDVRAPALILLWMSSAVVVGAVGGNATLLVILGVALVWRWRDQPSRAAAALVAAICIKLFVWPIAIWLALTGRYRAAIYSCTASAILICASWTLIGFDGLLDYPTLLDSAAEELGKMGFLAYALAIKSTGHIVAVTVTLAVAGVLLFGVFRYRHDDRASFTLALLAALYATPIVWVHYFGLLIVPSVLYGGWLWAAIPLLWIFRLVDVGHPRPAWLIAAYVAITAVFALQALDRRKHGAVALGASDALSTTGVPVGTVARTAISEEPAR